MSSHYLLLVLLFVSGIRGECHYRLRGQPYTGTLNVSGSGVVCNQWTYNAEFGTPGHDHNYCREASGLEYFMGRPWCYVNVTKVDREFCEVPEVECLNGGWFDGGRCGCVCREGYGGASCNIVLSDEETPTVWPMGEYALPMPAYGCPDWSNHKDRSDADASDWSARKEGGVSICMPPDLASPEARDSFRRFHYMYKGPYRENNFVHNFCIKAKGHGDESGDDGSEETWPKGTYCIYSVGYQCPHGFLNTTLNLHENCEHNRETYGQLPDIHVDTGDKVVTIGLCCRRDSTPTQPMRLPTHLPFYLLQESSTAQCQIVEGMRVNPEAFPVDARQIDATRPSSIIKLIVSDNVTYLNTCFYETYEVEECYDPRDNGILYRGFVNVTEDGVPCTKWDNSAYYYRPSRDSSIQYLGNEGVNYCRQPDQKTSPWCYTGGRSKNSWGFCPIPPCRVTGDVSENLAIGKPVTIEPYSYVKGLTGLAVDGRTDTCSRSLPSSSPWLQVDLQEIFLIHSLHLHINRISKNDPGFRHMDIHISLLPSFSQRGAFLCRNDVTVGIVTNVRVDCVQPIIGQFVTLQNTVYRDGSTASVYTQLEICEIQVFGIRTLMGIPAGLTSEQLTDTNGTSQLANQYGYREPLSPQYAPLYRANVFTTPRAIARMKILYPSLHGGAWCADSEIDREQLFTVDLGVDRVIQAITTQGYDPYLTSGLLYYTSHYIVQYTRDGRWVDYADPFGYTKIFEGNTDGHHPVRNTFIPNIHSRYLRVKVVEYVGQACLRLELYISKNKSEIYCGNTVKGNHEILSPNYPLYYGERRQCVWYVTMDAGTFVDLSFGVFDLAIPDVPSTEGAFIVDPGNCTDTISVYFHTGERYDLIRVLTPGSDPPLIVSTTNHIKLEFVTCYRYSATSASGFLANVSQTECGGCGVGQSTCGTQNLCKSKCGVITSINYPNHYSHNLRCHWSIRLEYGQYISLIFHKFDIIDVTEGNGCYGDYIEIFDLDVSGTNAVSLGRMCSGVLEPDDVYSSWHRMNIEFTSDSETHGRGFHISYESLTYAVSSDVLQHFNSSSADCSPLWHRFKSSCYRLFSGQFKTWRESEAYCVAQGGHLVGIGDRDEMSAIHYLLLSLARITDPLVYIGLNDQEKEGTFVWSDGLQLTYTDWHTSSTESQPNGGHQEQCGMMDISNIYMTSHWHDIPCALNDVQQFICEISHLNSDIERTSPINRTELHSQWTDASQRNVNLFNYFTCSTGEVILSAYVCDRHIDCTDASDESYCVVCDPKRQFECADHSCVSISKFCDYHKDCVDGSDEFQCVPAECMTNEWQCDSGECVGLEKRCDVFTDCQDSSDEDNCLTCNTNSSFQCYDGQCITLSTQCDGQADCSGLKSEDETGICRTVRYKKSCADWREAGYTKSGIYDISLDGITKMKVECEFLDDRHQTVNIFHHNLEDREYFTGIEHNYIRKLIYTQASLKQLREFVLYSRQCWMFILYECKGSMLNKGAASVTAYDHTELSYIVDRGTNCTCLLQGNCHKGTNDCYCDDNISTKFMSDFGNITSLDILPVEEVRFGDTGSSNEAAYHTIDALKCLQSVDMVKARAVFSCKSGPSIHSNLLCLHQYNKYGVNVGCRDLSHLLYCERFKCPFGWHKCLNSFCVPIKMVCDGRKDCPSGDDEFQCGSYSCHGLYRCRNSTNCLLPSQLCDANIDCAEGDDEHFCNAVCPKNCHCDALSVSCHNFNKIPENIYQDIRTIDLRNNVLLDIYNDTLTFNFLYSLNLMNCSISRLFPYAFSYLSNLRELVLRNNKLTILEEYTFSGLSNLIYLDLTRNKFIESLVPGCFYGLTKLPVLNLVDSKILRIESHTFAGLDSLELLNLTSNIVQTIHLSAFSGLYQLRKLDIRNNSLTFYEQRLLDDLFNLNHIYGDSYVVCCLAEDRVSSDNCLPEKDELSSCGDLMSRPVLRISLWIVGSIALIGNLFVVVYRLVGQVTSVNGIIITNLAVSDFLMGVYLYVIASADMYYRGGYVFHQQQWVNSVVCKISGFLATLSIEASTMSIGLLTGDRLTHIAFPLSDANLSRKSLRYVLATIWLLAVSSALIPLLPIPQLQTYFEDKFYSKTGACLPFQLSTNFEAGWEYSIVLFMVFNSTIYVFVTFGYLYIYNVVKTSGSLTKTAAKIRNTELAAARKMSLLVITNIVCWFPTFVIGIMVLMGAQIPSEIYAWISVFVLPVNSAANPILYTISPLLNFATLMKSKKDQKMTKSATTAIGTPASTFESFSQEITMAQMSESTAKLLLEHVPPPQQFLARCTIKVTDIFGLSTRAHTSIPTDHTSLSNLPDSLTWARLYAVALSLAHSLNNLDDSGLTVMWDEIGVNVETSDQKITVTVCGNCCPLQPDSSTKDGKYYQNVLSRLARSKTQCHITSPL